jgi:hypothetical protein
MVPAGYDRSFGSHRVKGPALFRLLYAVGLEPGSPPLDDDVNYSTMKRDTEYSAVERGLVPDTITVTQQGNSSLEVKSPALPLEYPVCSGQQYPGDSPKPGSIGPPPLLSVRKNPDQLFHRGRSSGKEKSRGHVSNTKKWKPGI